MGGRGGGRRGRRDGVPDGSGGKEEEPGDVVDEMMDAIREAEPALRGDGVEGGWREIEIDVEWGSTLILARRR